MSIKLLESFDHSTNINQIAAASYRWTGHTNFITTASGRTGRAIETASTAAFIYIHLNTQVMPWSGSATDGTDELYLGFAFRLPSVGPNMGLCGLWGGSGNGNQIANGVLVESDGSIEHVKGTGLGSQVNLGASIPGVVTAATWHYLEWRIKRATSGGRSIVKIDGITVLDFTGDTHDGDAHYLLLGNNSPGGTSFDPPTGTRFDDLYIVDPDGTGNWNGFLGPTYVPLLAPNANGSNSDWLGSDGNSTDNYALVDETSSVNDLDYVEASADGDIDTYEHGTYIVPVGHAIASVQVTARAAYLAGAKTLKVAARLEDSTYESKATTFPLSASLNPRWNNFEDKPGGGSWEQTDLDDAEFGVEQAT